MKSVFALSVLCLVAFSNNVFAETNPEGNVNSENTKAESKTVKWIGEVSDTPDSHTNQHWHELKFTRKDNGDVYDIVDSPELAKLHHETGKNYLMEIEAEITPRFLFWGGNLVVKAFKVVSPTSDSIPHKVDQAPRMIREGRK